MTIPSTVDRTLAPPGGHVVQLFTQYTPYKLSGGQQWTHEIMRNNYADTGTLDPSSLLQTIETDRPLLSIRNRRVHWKKMEIEYCQKVA